MSGESVHPRQVLLGSHAAGWAIPVCDHYCGVEVRMRKSLALQNELRLELGRCVMDVTLDCEDGAAVGAERDHAQMVLELAQSHHHEGARIAVRVHAVDHPAFEEDLAILLGSRGGSLRTNPFCHLMIPKVERLVDVERVCRVLDDLGASQMPIHCLIESAHAVAQAFQVAAHPRVQSLSFGLMDFVSSHGGAIGARAMAYPGQFEHPLVVRAKLEMAAACHAHGKTPAHCVVTEYKSPDRVLAAAKIAAQQLGYTRMWSIHPDQVRPILAAFAPDPHELALAQTIVLAAMAADWAPISLNGQLHDRASYRYYWQQIERAHATGLALNPDMTHLFAPQAALLH